MKKWKLCKPISQGVPPLKKLDKLMTGVDLWEMDKTPLPRSFSTGPKDMPALDYLQGSLTAHHFIKEIKSQCDYEKNFFITAYVH